MVVLLDRSYVVWYACHMAPPNIWQLLTHHNPVRSGVYIKVVHPRCSCQCAARCLDAKLSRKVSTKASRMPIRYPTKNTKQRLCMHGEKKTLAKITERKHEVISASRPRFVGNYSKATTGEVRALLLSHGNQNYHERRSPHNSEEETPLPQRARPDDRRDDKPIRRRHQYKRSRVEKQKKA